jgi:ankyrin repeat protein
MAAYVGLASLIPHLRGTNNNPGFKVIHVHRGYDERDVVLLKEEEREELEWAIANDDTGLAKDLIQNDLGWKADWLPLHKAALSGSFETFRCLSSALRVSSLSDERGRTVLHQAALCRSIDIINTLATQRPTNVSLSASSTIDTMINQQDRDGQTPLIIATRMGHSEAAILLASAGADISVQDATGKTSMHYAILNCLQIVGSLIEHDPNVMHIPDQNRCTPLHLAARSGCLPSVTTLIEAARAAVYLNEALCAEDKENRTTGTCPSRSLRTSRCCAGAAPMGRRSQYRRFGSNDTPTSRNESKTKHSGRIPLGPMQRGPGKR